MTWKVLLFVATAAATIAAQAPLPRALKDARTAYLTSMDLDRSHIDRLAKELQAWKRFELVDEPAKADILIGLMPGFSDGDIAVPVGGSVVRRSRDFLTITVRSKNESNLWEDRERQGMGTGAAATLVKRLRQRFEDEAKTAR